MRSMTTLASASVLLGSLVLPPIPYPLGEQSITCNFLENTYCPIIATEVVQYKLSMFIASFMAEGTNAIVEFYVVDQETNPVFCVRVPISVAPAINSNMKMTANSARSSKDVN